MSGGTRVKSGGSAIEDRQFATLRTFEVSLGTSMLTAVKLLERTKRATPRS
jgi:hypothetical protein